MQYADRSFPHRWHLELTGSSELAAQALLAFYLAMVVASLTAVALAAGIALSPSWSAVPGTAISLCLLPLFAFTNFSFGYSVGVAFTGMVVDFVWLSHFTSSRYDPAIVSWSALASLAFLVPVLLQNWPAPRMFGDSCSRHLSPLMIATSSPLTLMALLNFPLSTTLLSNGLLLLSLLWCVCPGEQDESRNYLERPNGSSADFRADCIMEGVPVHFRRDGVIDAIVDGRVVVFESWVGFFKFLRR